MLMKINDFEHKTVELIKKKCTGKTEGEMAAELNILVSEVNTAVTSLLKQRIFCKKGSDKDCKPIYGFPPCL